MLVTDIKRPRKDGSIAIGFYMQKYLAENLAPLRKYLDAAWDCVGIVSGHGKVRIGKSSMAAQIGYFIAWILSGGQMDFENNCVLKKPDRKWKDGSVGIKFSLQENLVFSADDLQERAKTLYDKYGPNQVIIYDEGRQGLESARAMENINKGMEDFFQEAGVMGHVMIVVLPSFFKLHEDYATARSLFLVDVFAKGGVERGYFNFYNETQKEWLYYLGKKKIGIANKYMSANESFWGKFTKWFPFDKKQYEQMKMEALEKKRKTRREKNLWLQRDFLLWRLKNHYEEKDQELLEEMEKVIDVQMGERTLRLCRERINEIIAKKKGY